MDAYLRTIVVQSFRDRDVPDWIKRCQSTVRAWAMHWKFTYRIIGDEFLDLVPNGYRQKARHHITVVADLARLLLAQQCLAEGFDRVIWIDADLAIFNPQRLGLDPGLSYGYCREVWVEKNRFGRIHASLKVNNAACLFRNDNVARAHLDDYIDACTSIVAGFTRVRDHTEVGTKFLTSRDRQRSLPVLAGFGLINPVIMQALLTSDIEVLKHFMTWQDGPLYGANLCNFFRPKTEGGPGISDEVYSAVLDKLMESEGYLLNGLQIADSSARSAP
jgi:hypothetical protein